MRDEVPGLIHAVSIDAWPRLAWCTAFVPGGDQDLTLYHGPDVEIGGNWAVEGVWPGHFDRAGFHVSPLFFGSGIRFDRGAWHFVSSCATVDRIWHFEDPTGRHFVSNSLPALVALSGLELSWSYPNYRSRLESIKGGLEKAQTEFPVATGRLSAIYHGNLVWDGETVSRQAKPQDPQEWTSFEDYREYLFQIARGIGRNAKDAMRKVPLAIATTVSRGYDSPAASVIALEAGAKRAFTISRARSLLPRSDDGSLIAKSLGIRCTSAAPSRRSYRDEEFFLAALGWSMDLNMSLFHFSTSPVVLFTGFHGDKVWGLEYSNPQEAQSLVRGDPSGSGFCEFRLAHGVIHVPVPFFGARTAHLLNPIARSPSMANWRIGGDYDRPIARRLVEEAGVERGLFGQTKSASTLDGGLHWPHTPDVEAAYIADLRAKGITVPWIRAARVRNQLDMVVFARARRMGAPRWLSTWADTMPSQYLFPWAVCCLARRLQEVLPVAMRAKR